MNVIRVSASADILDGDSTFILGFMYSGDMGLTDKNEDTSEKYCTILLLSGLKVNGKYLQTLSSLGYTIFSYSFTPSDFQKLAEEEAKAFMISTPKITNAEYELKGKYSSSIKKVVGLLVKTI